MLKNILEMFQSGMIPEGLDDEIEKLRLELHRNIINDQYRPHRKPLYLTPKYDFMLYNVVETVVICGVEAEVLWEGRLGYLSYLVITGHGLLTFGLTHRIVTVEEAQQRYQQYVEPTIIKNQKSNGGMNELIASLQKLENCIRYPF